MPSRKLTEKQLRFVEEYLVDLDPTKAATRAGYSTGRRGHCLLAFAHVREAVDTAKKDRIRRTHITQDRVVEELAAVGFVVMSDLCRWDASGVSLVESGRLTREQAAAVAEIVESGAGKGAVRIKLHGKLKALEMLGRHLGMFGADASRSGVEPELEQEPLAGDLAERLRNILAPPEDIEEKEEETPNA